MAEEKAKRAILRPTEDQRYPFVSLPKALDRVRALYKTANVYEVPASTAAKAWGYAEKSSGGVQTIAALKMFGLLSDSGSGPTRKVKITETGLKIIRDPRELSPERDGLIRETALKPSIHRSVLGNFGGGLPPSDEAFKAYLIMELGMKDSAVDDFMREFTETMALAKVGAADILMAPDEINSGIDPETKIKVGDHVQWTSGGVDQFKVPRKVVGLWPDGEHVQVFSSNVGIPMRELTVVDPPAVILPPKPINPPVVVEASSAGAQGENDFNVLQRGERLQITADVDLEGLAMLKEMLGDYESILKRLAARKTK